MNSNVAQQYLRTRVLTATPEQLQLMLFDGALRFGEQARVALQNKKFEDSFNNISRMQKILTELSGNLKREIAPDLCGKLASLYLYAYKKTIVASVEHKIDALDEAMKILRYQRETWAMLLEQLSKKKAAAAATRIDMPGPDSRMESSIRMTG